jgi:undecaprenyl-diphosphatase
MLLAVLKALLFGIVEGVTEWLPVSSTGHIILLNAFVPLNVSQEFYDLFEILIQLGAIFAVLVLYFRKLNPFGGRRTLTLWGKVLVGVIPSAV